MNISKKILLGASVLAMAACSSEEPLVEGGATEAPGKPSGDVAYLNVRINAADNSRAASGEITDEDGTKQEYIYGDGDENRVKNAYFFFYDENGQYVLQSNSWVDPATNGTTENVELKGQNTVVLTGLTGKNYPSWVVTVLNCPENFVPGNTLDEMGQKLIDSYMNNAGDFIMSTSSYFGTDNSYIVDGQTKWNYFATKLNTKNFLEETPNFENRNDESVVDIYVERLAVRVGVDISNLQNPLYTGAKYNHNGKDYDLYELNVSVSGNDNPDLGGAGAGTAATKVYVAIIGWELNATAKRTNLMKDLGEWNGQTVFGDAANTWKWNNAAYHRSYWGKSYTYGSEGTELAAKLNHGDYSWDQLTKQVGTKVFNGSRVYCNETTNVPANIIANGSVSPQKTPTVLLSAVVCDENGKPLELVNYRGVEFTKESFINKALSTINKTDMTQNYYTREQVATAGDGVTPIYEYNQIEAKDVKLVSSDAQGIGAVKLAVNDETVTYYQITGTLTQTDETGKEYTTYQANAVSAATVNSYLASATNGVSNKAIAKTDGSMFYPIVLEHLNQPEIYQAGKTDAVIEGQYGLVRNHIYNLSISKIKTLGDGVFKPVKVGDEGPEKLDPEDPKDPTYYVESAVNILSWKVVSQQVEI
ncbi:MAG: fimbria major subunit [Muribaculaceae bacterium]|nr:fimbria major subunit [Muribaculaceae bacterium]